MFGDVLGRKEAFVDNQNMYLIFPKNRKFLKGVNPMIVVEKLNFLHGLCLLKVGSEMMFGDVLDRKEAFLDNKNMYFLVRKFGNFPKGLTRDFGQKLELSSLFVFIENRSRNDVWECSR